MTVLDAINVTKSYDTGDTQLDAVHQISLSVEKGEFLAIIGRSGSGKSTLLSLLGAIEKPTAGSILLEGRDLTTLNDEQRTLLRRRRIGFVFQSFNLLPTLTALENVSLPLELDGIPRSAARSRAAEALKLVNLSRRCDHLPSMLSGGEQQLVAIARALVTQPALLLADEPTGNLDSQNSEYILGLLRDLVDVHQHTVVMVTHDMNMAVQADRIVRLRDGRIIGNGGPEMALDEVALLATNAI